jgi:hypothetical protein
MVFEGPDIEAKMGRRPILAEHFLDYNLSDLRILRTWPFHAFDLGEPLSVLQADCFP